LSENGTRQADEIIANHLIMMEGTDDEIIANNVV